MQFIAGLLGPAQPQPQQPQLPPLVPQVAQNPPQPQQPQQGLHPMNGVAAAAAQGAAAPAPSHGLEWLSCLPLQSAIDVYDIHESGWRRATLIGKRDRHEFLVRYHGWDNNANSKTSALAYTGFKGPKSADELASIELGHDWEAARQEGVMCDVLLVLHGGQLQKLASQHAKRTQRGSRLGTPLSSTPPRRSLHSSPQKDEVEGKGMMAYSAPSTPATSPMVRGLSGRGLISPHLGPISSPSSGPLMSPPLVFPAHSLILQMRCPDLLKPALSSLPPETTFEEGLSMATATTPINTPQKGDERKEERGGRSLADQERQANSQASTAASPILHSSYSLSGLSPADVGFSASTSPDQPLSSTTPASASGLEEKTRSLDDDEDMLGAPAAASSGLSRSGSFTGVGGFSELHPSVQSLDVNCVPNAATMQNLLTYIYTGDISPTFIQSVRHVFELATVAHFFHLDRLKDLCALQLNRMLNQDNFLLALKCALHYQSKVLGNLENICAQLNDASAAATASLASEYHALHHTHANAKIHLHMSPLVRVCFEYIIMHWDMCWQSYDNLVQFQQLPPPLFHTIMRLLPLKNIAHSPFAVLYPTLHPQPCALTSHFRRLYEQRDESNTDFKILIEEDKQEHVIPVHRAVLGQRTDSSSEEQGGACRSEYFRALFRCSFEEGKDSCLRLDASQHNRASIEALIKFLYSADLKVDPNCGVYLSNCTDFFGLSSTALENACSELISQRHCLKVLKAAWRSCNEGLFKRACKFIDWTTLATLMNGQAQQEEEERRREELEEDSELEEEEEGEEDEEEEEGLDEEEEEEEDADDTVPAAASVTASPPSSNYSTPIRSGTRTPFSPSTPLSPPAIDPSDVELWKAIVAEKANPSTTQFSFTRQAKRTRS